MKKTIYFDNAATTFPKPEEVYTFMDTFYRECGVNVGRGQHKLASKAAALVEETRELLLELNHCLNRKVVFSPTATEALNIILRGLIRRNNINVYITPFEHNAVTRVLHNLSIKFQINVHTLSCDRNTFNYDLEKIKSQFIHDNPDIVIISQASNVCGVIAPIEDICDQSKLYGAINVIDMCQTMGLIDTNLNNENIDYAVFAAHKMLYGAFGIGGFICRYDARLEPLIYGGTGVESASPNLPNTIPEMFEVGSPNILSIAGLNASLKWMRKLTVQQIYEKEKSNHRRLLDTMIKFKNINVISPSNTEKSIGVVSCVFEDYSSDSIGIVLSKHDIAVRTGLHCAPNAHRFLGTYPAGTVRFSVSYFNDEQDFIQLEKVLNFINENS